MIFTWNWLADYYARVVYHRLQDRKPFTDEPAADYERQRRAWELTYLTWRANTLGYA